MERSTRWTSLICTCVEEHYRTLLQQWLDGSTPEPETWQETLCWAGMLTWNSAILGMPECLTQEFPNKPSFPVIIERMRDYGMQSIATGLELVLGTLPEPVQYGSELSETDIKCFELPMRDGWEHGIYKTAIRHEDVPESSRAFYNAYILLSRIGNAVEIYRFLEDQCAWGDCTLDLNLLSWRDGASES